MAEAEAHDLVGIQPPQGAALERHRAFLGLHHAGHGLEDRRLAGAVGADDGGGVACRDGKEEHAYGDDLTIVSLEFVYIVLILVSVLPSMSHLYTSSLH